MPDNFKDVIEEETKKAVLNSIGYVWFVFLAIWGGTASYIGRIKKSGKAFSFIELMGEWTICSFAGIITAYLCVAANLDFYKTAALTGIAGHLGGRGVFMIENYIKNKYFR